MRPGNLCSAQDKTEEEAGISVFSAALLGEPGLAFDMCWRCGVQTKPLNYFLEPPKRPCTSKGI